MLDRETRRYQMFGRGQTFGKDNLADFAPGGEAIKRFTSLGQVIKDLEAAKASQQPGSATAKEVLIDALRLDLQNVARTARALEQDEPGVAAKYRLPDSQSDLLTAADAIIIEVKKAGVAAKFIAHELPADFVQHLVDDRKAIDDAQDAEESDDSEGVESTAAVGRLIRDGMKAVKYLDAIMHNKYSRHADKLRAWQSASHIERAPQREKKTAPAKTPAP